MGKERELGYGRKKGSAREVEKWAREGDRPDRGTMSSSMGGQYTCLVVVTARVMPLICTRWRCVAMGERGERGRKKE